MYKDWKDLFRELGLDDEEIQEIVELAIKKSNACDISVIRLLNSIHDVIYAFKPNTKIGDWLDIFREEGLNGQNL